MMNTMNYKPYFYSILNPSKLQAERIGDGTFATRTNSRGMLWHCEAEEAGLIEILDAEVSSLNSIAITYRVL